MNCAIDMRQVDKNFDGEIVLQRLDLSVTSGSVHAILGPNGAGKSTLLRLMVGLLRPSAGEISVLGESVADNVLLRQRVHYVGADTQLYPMFSVEDILRYARLLYHSWNDERCQTLLQAWNLPTQKRVRQLSLGNKMKLKMVIALSSMATILLLDEATIGLDPVSKHQVIDVLLQEMANREVTLVIATHQLSEVEQLADTLSVLGRGRILTSKNLDELKETIYEVRALVSTNHDFVPLSCKVLSSTKSGQRVTMVVDGARPVIEAEFAQIGASIIDISPAPVESWLQALLQKEGIVSGRITLPQGSTL